MMHLNNFCLDHGFDVPGCGYKRAGPDHKLPRCQKRVRRHGALQFHRKQPLWHLCWVRYIFPVITNFVVATGGPSLAATKCVIATAVAIGEAAMGCAVATGGLPWVVSVLTSKLFIERNNKMQHKMFIRINKIEYLSGSYSRTFIIWNPT